MSVKITGSSWQSKSENPKIQKLCSDALLLRKGLSFQTWPRRSPLKRDAGYLFSTPQKEEDVTAKCFISSARFGESGLRCQGCGNYPDRGKDKTGPSKTGLVMTWTYVGLGGKITGYGWKSEIPQFANSDAFQFPDFAGMGCRPDMETDVIS